MDRAQQADLPDRQPVRSTAVGAAFGRELAIGGQLPAGTKAEQPDDPNEHRVPSAEKRLVDSKSNFLVQFDGERTELEHVESATGLYNAQADVLPR